MKMPLAYLKDYSSLLLIFQIRVHMYEYISPEDNSIQSKLQQFTDSKLVTVNLLSMLEPAEELLKILSS